MNQFFKELFEYTHAMNQKLVDALLAQPHNISEKSSLLMSHTLNAHHIWNARIEKAVPAYGVWQVHEPRAWEGIDQNNYQKTSALLLNTGLDQVMVYKNSRGDIFENTVRDILFHIINHSTYHRGQIASDMKLQGFEPISSDYIFYKR